MAEEPDKKIDVEVEDKKEKKKEALSNEWEKITEGKYKSPEEVAKALKEAEKKMGDLSKELGDGRAFAQTVQPLLETLRDDPELFKRVDEALKKRHDKNEDKKEEVKPDAIQKEVRDVTSDIIVQRFEEKYGIDKMDAEKRRELRQKIGTEIENMTGKTLDETDLRRLPQVLESSYILANKDSLIDKAKLEAQLKAKEHDELGIGSLSSQSSEKGESLSAEEERVAKKMGLTSEQYLASKKKASR